MSLKVDNDDDDGDYVFLRILQSNSIHKSINLIYILKDLIQPIPSQKEQEKWDSNPALFIDWSSKVFAENPNAFSLDLYQKSAFPLEKSAQVPSLLLARQTLQINDIYHRYLFDSSEDLSRIQLNRIRPCTPIHIKKYIQGIYKRVKETPTLYNSIVLPYINSIDPSRNAWIDKVLRKESEQEICLFHDPHPTTGFILLPDSKWDRVQASQLYLLAISQSADIKSLRDLRGGHVGFLKAMRAQILLVVKEKYGLTWRDVRLLIHYQPSYYHFHVHVINVAVEGLAGTVVGQCHLLEDVIENLENDGDYYAKRNLVYALSCFHPLYESLVAE